ncbi:unnamed protein product [Paramecium sonneborni]|uniref:Uncharacterized protein n=1 Tax=Paramecium sonneborni TaxID=65129 RepID=A0A8S1RSS7_9CILI|nr:unnamed protein product [Paramecium sonneborni]
MLIGHQVPNVEFINQQEEISRTKGIWKNQKIQQLGSTVTIDSQFTCFNINLSSLQKFLIDCYQNYEFVLIQLMDEQSILAHSIQSTNTFATFIIIIIFYQSSQNNKFIDFDIDQDGNQKQLETGQNWMKDLMYAMKIQNKQLIMDKGNINLYSGGGSYHQNESLKKIGKWAELDQDFNDGQHAPKQIIHIGEYDKKGQKIGIWIEMDIKDNKNKQREEI